jgi:NAD(P)-dependent dehydrogenase (short-subunit alcohol dehydrogenase family)
MQTALVTGASRGIGKSIAVALAKAGYDVAVAARTVAKGEPTHDHTMTVHHPDASPLPGSLEETAELIRSEGRKALAVRMDLLDLASVETAVQTVLDEWGGVDVVINNGRHIGPGLMDTILDTPVVEYERFMQAHGTSAIRIVQLTLPGMLERGAGTFVTISSSAGYEFYPQTLPGRGAPGLGYRIGKAAGHTIVGSILVEYADQGIRAFNVNPGFVGTERNESDSNVTGMDRRFAAPPGVVGAAVAWMVSSPEADDLMRGNIDAQSLALERGLHPDWRQELAV